MIKILHTTLVASGVFDDLLGQWPGLGGTGVACRIGLTAGVVIDKIGGVIVGAGGLSTFGR